MVVWGGGKKKVGGGWRHWVFCTFVVFFVGSGGGKCDHMGGRLLA